MTKTTKNLLGAFFTSIAAFILGACKADRPVSMDSDGRAMMHYGWYSDETYFDASEWFRNGMYKRHPDPTLPSGYSDVIMHRVSPLPFKDSELLDVRVWLVVGLNPVTHDIPGLARVPDDYEAILMDSRFDPRPQIRYVSSYFMEPDFPVDIYGCYLLIKGKRFFVDLKRDGRTGEFIRAGRAFGVTSLSLEEENELFKKLEEKQAQQKPQSLPPGASQQAEPVSYTVRGGSRCPRTGWWYTHVDGGKPRFFREGEIFPEFPPDPSYWQWGHETPPKP